MEKEKEHRDQDQGTSKSYSAGCSVLPKESVRPCAVYTGHTLLLFTSGGFCTQHSSDSVSCPDIVREANAGLSYIFKVIEDLGLGRKI